jgi:hypothetical protein
VFQSFRINLELPVLPKSARVEVTGLEKEGCCSHPEPEGKNWQILRHLFFVKKIINILIKSAKMFSTKTEI